jgi:hypothetical protein
MGLWVVPAEARLLPTNKPHRHRRFSSSEPSCGNRLPRPPISALAKDRTRSGIVNCQVVLQVFPLTTSFPRVLEALRVFHTRTTLASCPSSDLNLGGQHYRFETNDLRSRVPSRILDAKCIFGPTNLRTCALSLCLARVCTWSMPVSLATFSWSEVPWYCALNLDPSVHLLRPRLGRIRCANIGFSCHLRFLRLDIGFLCPQLFSIHHLTAVLHPCSSKTPSQARVKGFQ